MTELISDEKRAEIEKKIYNTLDKADKTHSNSDYYKEMFSKMNNNQFYHFLEKRLPFRFHTSLFKVEPKMSDIFEAFKVLKKPLLEKVYLPYLYQDKDGNPITSKEALVVYINLKRMKQMLSKKNSTAIEITQRDMKTGRLLNEDKGGQMTDREFETLAIPQLNHTIDEFATFKGDYMKAKAAAYNTINTKGMVSEKDIPVESSDSLGKNMLNVYLLGAHIYSNLINEDYMTPLTLKNKQSTSIKRD